MRQMHSIRTSSLEIAYEESGPATGDPLILLHGWPYDPRSFDDVVAQLEGAGYRVLVPYVRGFGPTRYANAGVRRSGQQTALALDVVELMDALGLPQATLAGFDWGNRSAIIVAALWPERVRALVSCAGYTVIDPAVMHLYPGTPAQLHQAWYRFVLNAPNAETYLRDHRDAFARECWKLWSPGWNFPDALFTETGRSFQSEDWVQTTLHCYRFWYGNAAGEPRLEPLERRLRSKPPVLAPTIVLAATDDPLFPAAFSKGQEGLFKGPYERRVVQGAGHYLPKEAPEAFTQALLDVRAMVQG